MFHNVYMYFRYIYVLHENAVFVCDVIVEVCVWSDLPVILFAYSINPTGL